MAQKAEAFKGAFKEKRKKNDYFFKEKKKGERAAAESFLFKLCLLFACKFFLIRKPKRRKMPLPFLGSPRCFGLSINYNWIGNYKLST